MGLRINTNVGALTALRNLQSNSARETRTLERLATGLRINRASDDPAGLVIVEALRPELAAISQALENTQNARNLVSTADAALGAVSDRLVEMRGLLVAAGNTGAMGPEARQALQDALDAGLAAIDRIGATTRFADQPLLNGSLGFNVTGVSPELTTVDVQGGSFDGGFPVQVGVTVTTAATQAQAAGTIAAVQSGASTVNIRGPGGMEQLQIAAGATQADVIQAVNDLSERTGVEATPAGELRTVEFGSQATLQLEEVAGDLEGIAPGVTKGTDVVAQVDGQPAAGRGNTIQTNTDHLAAVIQVEPGVTGSFGFTIAGGGATFQVGPVPGGANDVTIGIGAVNTATLGRTSGLGTLSTLRTGGGNDLESGTADATAIVNAAANEVAGLRSRLGSLAGRVFQANEDALNVEFEKLTASASAIRDADMAAEIAQSVRNRLVRESGLLVLGQANLTAGQALRLLA
ncbi:MAG: flagellin [Planctomycetes bacterium]|nr:flagellin [Planctomycetota bacterium]